MVVVKSVIMIWIRIPFTKKNNMDKKLVAQKLREFIDSNFDKIKDFTDKLGMSQAAFQSSYLNGRSLPGAEILAKLAKMGCDINWLLSDDISPPLTMHEQSVPYNDNKVKILEQEKQTLIEENERLRSSIGGELALLSKKLNEGKGIAKRRK